jgi:hypothetical protein
MTRDSNRTDVPPTSIVDAMLLLLGLALGLSAAQVHWDIYRDFSEDSLVRVRWFEVIEGTFDQVVLGLTAGAFLVTVRQSGARRGPLFTRPGTATSIAVLAVAFISSGYNALRGMALSGDYRYSLIDFQEEIFRLADPEKYAAVVVAMWLPMWFGRQLHRPQGTNDWLGCILGISWLFLTALRCYQLYEFG